MTTTSGYWRDVRAEELEPREPLRYDAPTAQYSMVRRWRVWGSPEEVVSLVASRWSEDWLDIEQRVNYYPDDIPVFMAVDHHVPIVATGQRRTVPAYLYGVQPKVTPVTREEWCYVEMLYVGRPVAGEYDGVWWNGVLREAYPEMTTETVRVYWDIAGNAIGAVGEGTQRQEWRCKRLIVQNLDRAHYLAAMDIYAQLIGRVNPEGWAPPAEIDVADGIPPTYAEGVWLYLGPKVQEHDDPTVTVTHVFSFDPVGRHRYAWAEYREVVDEDSQRIQREPIAWHESPLYYVGDLDCLWSLTIPTTTGG